MRHLRLVNNPKMIINPLTLISLIVSCNSFYPCPPRSYLLLNWYINHLINMCILFNYFELFGSLCSWEKLEMFSPLKIYSNFTINKILFDGSQYVELEIKVHTNKHTSLVLVTLSNPKFFTCYFQGKRRSTALDSGTNHELY